MTGDSPGELRSGGPSAAAGGPQRPGPEDLGALIRQTVDPLQVMQRVADQLVEMLDAADGALVGVLAEPGTLRYVCGAGHLAAFVGRSLALEGSLSGVAIRTGRTLVTDDTEADGRVNREATRAFDVRSSVCVPLGPVERPVGILNVSSRSRGAFGEHDVTLLGGLAEFISTVIATAGYLMAITGRLCGRQAPVDGPQRRERFVASVLHPEGARRMAIREQVGEALEQGAFTIVFQPIFDLQAQAVFGAEALARFDGSPARPPDVWLAEAHEVGLGVELELALLEEAVRASRRLPAGVAVAVNAGPEALASPRVSSVLGGLDPRRLVVELTEHVRVDDYPSLCASLAELRDAGVRLAIDDAGAGFASLMHILRLAPDLIKLDRQLISGLDVDPVRRSLASSLMRFAEETGATMVAEGVETGSEVAALDELGIRHAQGFFLGRPGPVEQIAALRRSERPRGPGVRRRRRDGRPASTLRA